MGTYWSLPLVALAVIIQATFLPQMRIFGGQPDLIFLMTLSWAINGRLEQNVMWAFVGGITQDLMSAAPIGASSLGLIFVVFGIEALRQQVYQIGFLMAVLLVVVGTFLQKLVFMIVLAFSGYTVHPLENFTYVILPTIAYNLLFAAPVYLVMRRIQRRAGSRQHVLS